MGRREADRRRGGRLRLAPASVASALVIAFSACGVVLDTDGLVGPPAAAEDAATDAPRVADSEVDSIVDGSAIDVAVDAGLDAEADVVGPTPPPSCVNDPAFACVDEAPAGWSGPFAIYVGTTANAPTCGPVSKVLDAHSSLVAGTPATCPACACLPATGATCGKFTARGQSASCNNPGSTESLFANTCYSRSRFSYIDGSGFQSDAVDFGLAPTVGGACTPVDPTPTPTTRGSTVAWNIAAVGCNGLAPSTPGCAAGKVCASIPQAPFNSKLCVRKDGDVGSCPGAPYSQRAVHYLAATDTRDCAACTCGAPAASNCVGDAVLTNASNCSGGTRAPPFTCLQRGPGDDYIKLEATPPTNVACAPAGGAPVGGVVPAQPVTVCCVP